MLGNLQMLSCMYIWNTWHTPVTDKNAATLGKESHLHWLRLLLTLLLSLIGLLGSTLLHLVSIQLMLCPGHHPIFIQLHFLGGLGTLSHFLDRVTCSDNLPKLYPFQSSLHSGFDVGNIIRSWLKFDRDTIVEFSDLSLQDSQSMSREFGRFLCPFLDQMHPSLSIAFDGLILTMRHCQYPPVRLYQWFHLLRHQQILRLRYRLLRHQSRPLLVQWRSSLLAAAGPQQQLCSPWRPGY